MDPKFILNIMNLGCNSEYAESVDALVSEVESEDQQSELDRLRAENAELKAKLAQTDSERESYPFMWFF